MVQSLHITGALVWNGDGFEQRDLYTTDLVVEQRPSNALTIDLNGYTIFPGLINAHDHLELNHYPRTKDRERYDNASEWSRDMNAHLNFSPFKELRAYPLDDRCFIGGLKNLLCGATTVAHHNPPHKTLFRKDFPVRVLRKYGWAHSLYLSSDEEIVASYKATPPNIPWFIHLAEGTDYAARGEYRRLDALGCAGDNTVIIHGVGWTRDVTELVHRVGMIWCPSSNIYLLGEPAQVDHFMVVHMERYALGSDSRLTAKGDLLDEMRIGYHIYDGSYGFEYEVLGMVTDLAAQVLRLPNAGHLKPTAYADFIALRSSENNPAKALCESHRANLSLVVRGGEPQIGDLDLMAKFPHIETIRARLDDKEKRINVKLARQIARCTLTEPGLELPEVPSEFSFTRFWNGVRKL